VPDADGYYTSLEIVADYECPDCGEMADLFDMNEDEATMILGGDEHGNLVCPQCGEELDKTAEAVADHAAWLQEKLAEIDAKRAAP
jgi:predicted RNA-binding Zn-ribbon protein involved in translation (DUF1610 family)